MQAIAPVDVHIENDWHERLDKPSNRKGRQAPRIRTRVLNKTKSKKTTLPKQVIVPKLVSPVRSRSSSPNRGPWVPPPGRSTKGQQISWQGSKSRLEINPVTEIIIEDTPRSLQSPSLTPSPKTPSTETNEKFMNEIQLYEKRIQGLIDGIGMLKERIHNHASQDQTDQLRSDIDSSLRELEQLQENFRPRRSQSSSPIRTNNRSLSADAPRQKRNTTTKVSFQDDPPTIEKRRPRSTTPIRGPIYLNSDREQLLISLTESENDIAQIIKQLSSIKDVLSRLKFDDQSVSIEVDQLHRHRNELLHLIEQYERSNRQLKESLRHQYHLEAEDGIQQDQYETLKIHMNELRSENQQIRHVLLDRENENIALLTELERIRSETIGFDTMKSSLEHNRAHLQRELYAREGEINRLQCALRSLERDLQRSRQYCNHLHRSMKRPALYSPPSCSSPINIITKSKALTTERLPEPSIDETNSELVHLRAQLEQAEQLANEYKAQLHTQTLKTSANNSRNHLSEIELEKIRTKLQKRIEELEPLPELLKQAEMKNEILQKQINDLQRRIREQSPNNERNKEIHSNSDEENRMLQRKISSLEEQNDKLTRALHAKEDELRNTQPRSNTKPRENPINLQQRLPQPSIFDLEQQISRLRLEYNQLKREKDELERRFNSQLTDLRDKLEQSNNTNRSMQNYVNSLKTTYTTLFSDALPTSLARSSTT